MSDIFMTISPLIAAATSLLVSIIFKIIIKKQEIRNVKRVRIRDRDDNEIVIIGTAKEIEDMIPKILGDNFAHNTVKSDKAIIDNNDISTDD